MSDATAAPQTDLSAYTTLRLGGPAGTLTVATENEQILAEARKAPGKVLILAGGSNVVIGDDGFEGTVLLLRTRGIRVVEDHGDSVVLRVAAGEPWDDFVAYAVEQGFSGVECLSGIPGSAGATPIQNVGAYGQEVAHTIVAVHAYDRQSDTVRVMPPAECGFAYRTSTFKHDDRHVVLGVTFRLRRDGQSEPVRYAELARTLGIAPGGRAPLHAVRAAVLSLRAGKGMVLDPSDPDTYSAGSFFTNPVLDQAAYDVLRQQALDTTGAEPVAWPAESGVKISAAWLIERSGFHRGYRGEHAGVALSSKHTLALTNRGDGTTAALLGLAREIRDGVRKAFDVELHPEPVLINCTL